MSRESRKSRASNRAGDATKHSFGEPKKGRQHKRALLDLKKKRR